MLFFFSWSCLEPDRAGLVPGWGSLPGGAGVDVT